MPEAISENTYQNIKDYAISKMAKVEDGSHNATHIKRVEKNALEVIQYLQIEKNVDKKVLKISCLLHDLTYSVRKPGILTYFFEGNFAKKLVGKALDDFDIPTETKEIIINAIHRHTHSFPFRNLNKEEDIYTKVLQDADTLDFFNCLRLKVYLKTKSKGIFGGIRKFIAQKLVTYGMNNLKHFLNYPSLVKSPLVESTGECLL